MGFLLKIIVFGVAIYAAWRTVMHWKGVFDRVTGKPQPQPRVRPAPTPAEQPTPQRQAKVIDASGTCRVCGAYLSSAATRCGRSDCPLP
jgi:hypothetical protein